MAPNKHPGRNRPRPGLDEAAVLRAAAALVDAEGFESLSLARLAETLHQFDQIGGHDLPSPFYRPWL